MSPKYFMYACVFFLYKTELNSPFKIVQYCNNNKNCNFRPFNRIFCYCSASRKFLANFRNFAVVTNIIYV